MTQGKLRVKGVAATGIDSDAQAFITVAGITDTTQKSAINTLVVNLKAYGIWTKMKAIYPFVGGTATQHKFNLKDPRDLDVAFRLVFNGGITHTSNGIQGNGTNGYADTKLIPNNTITNSSGHLSVYSRTNLSGGVDMGSVSTTGGTIEDSIFSRWTDNKFYANYGTQSYPNVNNTDSRGLFITNRNSATNTTGFKNGSKVIDTAQTSPGVSLRIMPIGAYNNNGTFQYYSNRQYAFASIGDGLTDTEAANFYTAVQAFQTTLGRSIGTQTVSDADAQTFVTNAGIIDQVEATAVNNLVTGLKADSIWTKMKALYPMVGGTAVSHKFNLKDPRDLDAAYRLTFSGGWTHSSTGAKPNGSNAYADTKLNVNNILDINSTHLSYYSRTNATALQIDMGASNNGNGQTFLIFNYNTQRFIALHRWGQLAPVLSNTTGLLIENRRDANYHQSYKSGILVNTAAYGPVTKPSYNMYIGANNINGSPSIYGSKECAFATIGDGLTDAEATNFNTRVQAFQTTLNRNV